VPSILLDTNALLWQAGPTEGVLGVVAQRLLTGADKVYVSSITVVELQIKTMLGKLNVPDDCIKMITDTGDELLAYTPEAAQAIKLYPQLARHDPFDRMILAQATVLNVHLMTADAFLLALGLPFLIDARV